MSGADFPSAANINQIYDSIPPFLFFFPGGLPGYRCFSGGKYVGGNDPGCYLFYGLSTDALAAGTCLVLLEGAAQKGLLIIFIC